VNKTLLHRIIRQDNLQAPGVEIIGNMPDRLEEIPRPYTAASRNNSPKLLSILLFIFTRKIPSSGVISFQISRLPSTSVMSNPSCVARSAGCCGTPRRAR
jgi:hypothetical protein